MRFKKLNFSNDHTRGRGRNCVLVNPHQTVKMATSLIDTNGVGKNNRRLNEKFAIL